MTSPSNMGGEEGKRKEINHAGTVKLTFVLGHQSLYDIEKPSKDAPQEVFFVMDAGLVIPFGCIILKRVDGYTYISICITADTSLMLLLLLLGSRLCLNVRHLNGKLLKGSSSKLNGSI